MRNFLIVVLILLLIPTVLLAPSWLQFHAAQGATPPGVTLAGLDMTGLDDAGVADALNRAFDEPLAVFYDDQRILLRPRAVGFTVDSGAMLQEARTHAGARRELLAFLGQRIGRPALTIDVPLRYTLDQAALDNWLADVAGRYDRAPASPQMNAATKKIMPGKPGLHLDLPTSRGLIVSALTNPHDRNVKLALSEEPAPPINIKVLEKMLKDRLDQFPNIASVWLHHIPSGDEVAINADVAYAGMSNIKIAILEELFRKLDAPPDPATTYIITQTTQLSGNYTANQLLGIIGDGDPSAGVRVLDNSLHTLGLRNSFMATPYDTPLPSPPRIVTEANRRTDMNTHPDPYIQTTPRDIGTMMQYIVECSLGGGTLLAAYPGQITEAECKQMLDFLSLDELKELITGGVPAGTKVIHKHGYADDTHGDVAVIYGPDGPYVMSIYLYDPPWLEWTLSNGTMKELSAIAWDYFNAVAETH